MAPIFLYGSLTLLIACHVTHSAPKRTSNLEALSYQLLCPKSLLCSQLLNTSLLQPQPGQVNGSANPTPSQQQPRPITQYNPASTTTTVKTLQPSTTRTAMASSDQLIKLTTKPQIPSLASPLPTTESKSPQPLETSPGSILHNTPSEAQPSIAQSLDKDRQLTIEFNYSDLPANFAPAFMTVEALVNKTKLMNPNDPNSAMTVIAFGNETISYYGNGTQRVLKNTVSSTYKTLSYINGCCPMLRFYAANETLKNVYGVERRLVHFSSADPPRYQFIQHGLCASDSYDLNGHCLQGTVAMCLLVYDVILYPPITFDFFNVPAYCNCVHY